MRPTSIIVLSTALLGTACASTGPRNTVPYEEADWIIGTWRVDSYISAGSQRRDVLLHLTFLPTGFVDVVDRNTTSRLPAHCPWYPRVNWIDTSCGGIDIRVLPGEEGPRDVELAGTLRVPYYTDVCVRWEVDSQGNRVCVGWEQVERFRNVPARGRGILEPFRARD